MVHNLALVDWDRLDESEFGYDWALEASEKIKEYILCDDHSALINYRLQAERLIWQFQLLNIICPCCMRWL